ncbi:type I 3-dehydroquinate dehydratase [Rouxiella sp. WC2420]|uniref:3-dehydroquinate dehydratase n=1 Tax=Rouxiella sp. WC2420 TaxID=3234145 RepID=A0AB39VSH9_9GAMM
MKRREFMKSGTALIAGGFILKNASAAIIHPNSLTSSGVTAAPTGENKRMIKLLKVKGISIGEGAPKLIVPTTATQESEVLDSVRQFAAIKDIDVVEFRLDFLINALDKGSVARMTRQVADLLPDKVLLVTFRTQAEGGATTISDTAYGDLYLEILKNGKTDLLDVEMFRSETVVRNIVSQAHRQGVAIVMSSHDFKKTPPKEELIRRLRHQQALGADILKIATMPHDSGDVLSLMNATWEMHHQYAERPLLTMSMKGLGVVSRLSGELTGSALTFGMVGKPSAPGQIDASHLHQVLDVIHQASQSV